VSVVDPDSIVDQARVGSAFGPLSLAFACPGWPPENYANGIITLVSLFTEQMRRHGHDVFVLADRGSSAPGEDVRVIDGLRRSAHPAGRLVDILARRASAHLGERIQVVRAYRTMARRLIVERGLQLLEMEESFGYAREVQRALEIPVVVRLHGPWFLNGMDVPADKSYRHRVRAEGLAIRDAFAVSSPSLDVLNKTRQFYGLDLPNARVIHNSVEAVPEHLRWTPAGADPDEILFVGRFDRHKGGDVVIDAFAEVARRHPTARLRFVGPDRGVVDDSGRRWSIEEYASDRLGPIGALGRWTWMGQQPAVALQGLRRKAGVVVVGSRYDNFPTTVLEAMAIGCPLVAARAGGIPEMVDDGVDGLLFESGRPEDLAARLGRLLDDRCLAARLGHGASVESDRRFSLDVMTHDSEMFYREAIADFRRRRAGSNSR